eukprot:415124-Alexandrium_andersonii.AAC.1
MGHSAPWRQAVGVHEEDRPNPKLQDVLVGCSAWGVWCRPMVTRMLDQRAVADPTGVPWFSACA